MGPRARWCGPLGAHANDLPNGASRAGQSPLVWRVRRARRGGDSAFSAVQPGCEASRCNARGNRSTSPSATLGMATSAMTLNRPRRCDCSSVACGGSRAPGFRSTHYDFRAWPHRAGATHPAMGRIRNRRNRPECDIIHTRRETSERKPRPAFVAAGTTSVPTTAMGGTHLARGAFQNRRGSSPVAEPAPRISVRSRFYFEGRRRRQFRPTTIGVSSR